MSNYDINSNPALVKQMIENSKKASEKYFAEHPDSLILPLNIIGLQGSLKNQTSKTIL